MQVSRSGYYSYLKKTPSKKQQMEAKLLAEIKAAAEQSGYSYGKRRIAKHLQCQGYKIGVYAAKSLMRKAGVECKQRRRYRITTHSNHRFALASNVLNREFNVTTPNQVWTTDITYLWTCEGWLYIAGVLDLFSRRIVGWAIDSHMQESLVRDALYMALGRRCPKEGLLHHSDRGVQYASHAYQTLLSSEGIRVSMSDKGNGWDNAVMERFWSSLKSERTDHAVYKTREDAKADVINYIEMFYNSKRLHSTLGYLSPMQFEKNFS
jgi:putative transposase